MGYVVQRKVMLNRCAPYPNDSGCPLILFVYPFTYCLSIVVVRSRLVAVVRSPLIAVVRSRIGCPVASYSGRPLGFSAVVRSRRCFRFTK